VKEKKKTQTRKKRKKEFEFSKTENFPIFQNGKWKVLCDRVASVL